MDKRIRSKYLEIKGRNIHYLEVGQGKVLLFIHGFPTSAYLWRNIMSGLADSYKVIAIDLPGYGKSSKYLDDSYSFRYYSRLLTDFTTELGLSQLTLGVHDVGGPIGLYWMASNQQMVERLILFNTLVYPNFSWAVKLFALATKMPIIKDWMTSAKGIKRAIRFGVYDKENITESVIENYQSPFPDKASREALLKSVQRLSVKGFKEIEIGLHSYKGPVQGIYGEDDKILPNVAKTMSRVKANLPQTHIDSLANCGHFLQEDKPSAINEIIKRFMSSTV